MSELDHNREYQRQLQGIAREEAQLEEQTRIALAEPNFAAKEGLLAKVAGTANALARTAAALACMRRALAEPRRPHPHGRAP